jgi:hypothetical protein
VVDSTLQLETDRSITRVAGQCSPYRYANDFEPAKKGAACDLDV